jgi:hypothetical protein
MEIGIQIMAVKYKRKAALVCSVSKDGIIKVLDIPKTPHVRVFGVLTPIKESEIPLYEEANLKIEWV